LASLPMHLHRNGERHMNEVRQRFDILVSLRELNRRFLGLAGSLGRGTPLLRVAGLSEAQRAAAANCPYALFDVRFEDEPHWVLRLHTPPAWHVADASPVGA